MTMTNALEPLRVARVRGLLLCLIGAWRDQPQFSFSWLFGFIYFFTLVLFFKNIIKPAYRCCTVMRPDKIDHRLR